MKLRKPSPTDALLVVGFAAVCFGCWQLAPWSAFVVGGGLVMVYAWKRELAEALKTKGRNQ